VDQAMLEARRVAQASENMAQVPVRIVDRDVADIVLMLKPGVAVGGKIVIESQAAPPAGLDRVRVQVTPMVPLTGLPNPVAMAPNAEGQFQIAGLREGEFRLSVPGLPSGYYLRSLRYEGEDVLNNPLRFSGSGSGTLEVVLRAGAAQVTGTVRDAQGIPGPQLPVLLLPVVRSRTDLNRFALTDQSGRFTFPNLAPGQYRVLSMETLDFNSAYDPGLAKQLEQSGQVVVVAEGAAPDIAVRVVPPSQ
jgi:hypothetical protein